MAQIASLSWEFAIYGLIALGVVCLIGWAKLADLTPDASFASGAVTAWWVSQYGVSGAGLLVASLFAGAVAGVVTWTIIQARVQPLLASLVVVGVAYSVNWAIMGRPLRSIDPSNSIYDPSNPVWMIITPLIILIAIGAALYLFSMTSFGLALRASAENPGSLPNGERISRFASFFFLALGNGLVGLAGGLFSSRSFFVEINMGVGTLIVGLAAFLLGWSLFGFRTSTWQIITGAIMGAIIVRLLAFFALDAGLDASWFKAINALALLVCLILAGRAGREALRGVRL